MKHRIRTAILPALLTVSLAALPACQSSSTDRWVTTSNTNVEIDFDAVQTAYKEAEGPADFERRVNEIYTGDEIISVAVKDNGSAAQVVTGFFDKNGSGAVDENEKIFEITRNVTGEGGSYQVVGHGPYYGYSSPMMSIVSGMLIGSMIAGSMRPNYVPVAYTTSPDQRTALSNQRSAYRAANPSKFSQSGRSYGSGKSSFSNTRSGGGGSRSGGGRMGAKAKRPITRLAH